MSDSKILSSSMIDDPFLKDELLSTQVLTKYDSHRTVFNSENSFSDMEKLWKKGELGELTDEVYETVKTSTVKEEILQSQTKTLTIACMEDTSHVKEKFVNDFLQLLQSVEFKFGYKTSADDYVREALDTYGMFAREWLNEIFLQYFDRPQVISAILRVIAHFDYFQMHPQGITIAIAATRHEDIEVQECGVRCFENWESPESIPILKSLNFSESWLNDYLQNVITDLEDTVLNVAHS